MRGSEAIEVGVVGSVGEIGRDDWDRVAGGAGALDDGRPADPFVSFDFLDAVERSGSTGEGTGWFGRHLVIADADGRPIGLVPTWIKTHSRGEYVFDHAWAQAFERTGGRWWPKLQVAVPFTPVTGPRLLAVGDARERARIGRALIGGLEALTEQVALSSAHATFLSAEDAALFQAAGWSMRTDVQFHFPNRGYRDHDDFLSTLLGRKRKQLVRERREANAGVEIRLLTGAEIGEADWDAFFAFYMDTGSRKWGRPYLTRAFFSMIGETMADRLLLVMAYEGTRPVAGALNFIGREALYGRWWGTVEDRPFLHFEVCYHRAIDWAIAHGLERVEAGAQGEHKLARGYLPVVTRSAHRIVDARFRAAVERYLVQERAAIDEAVVELTAQSPYAARG